MKITLNWLLLSKMVDDAETDAIQWWLEKALPVLSLMQDLLQAKPQ